MYDRLKALVLRLLKVPDEPEDPMGSRAFLKVFRASPNYYRYKLLGFKISAALSVVIITGLAVGMVVAGLRLGGWALLLVPGTVVLLALQAASIAFNYVKLRLDYEMRWYKLTDRSLRVREGVVNVHEMTMTFDNIQNISINQGPLQRIFKIADLQVDSAGGGAGNAAQQGSLFNLHRVFFRGVDNAEEIRQLLLDRLKRLKTSGLGDADEAPAGAAADAAAPTAAPPDDAVLALLSEIRHEAALLRRAAQQNRKTVKAQG